MEKLIRHLEDNKLDYETLEIKSKFKIADQTFEFIWPDSTGRLFDDDLHLQADDTDCDNYAFRFGGDYYYINKADKDKPTFKELRYIGQSKREIETDAFLGVRGAYEILNGSRIYEDWCAKAKFLGVKSLGIIEKNTLAGALKFQIECKNLDIKPILGATYTVVRKGEDYKQDIKCFAKSETGWTNLLMINKEVNVINNKFIYEDRFIELLEDVIVIVDPKSGSYDKLGRMRSYMKYYQLDTVIYNDQSKDQEYLLNLKAFVRDGSLKPIFICDAFYLDRDHSHIKKTLNGISGVREYESSNQYFKDADDYLAELELLFSTEDESFYDIASKAIKNANTLSEICNFQIDTEHFYLPDYVLTEEQLTKYKDKIDLFWGLIGEGMDEKCSDEDREKYLDRIEIEYSVIMKGQNLIDYFLILWDIIDWCGKQNILVGYGRGSSAGSLIAYLLGITNIDPFEYDLLFERFLNENRVKKSIPDIDSDFEGLRRDEVKHYMEQRFGYDQVCSVGTYGNLKLKMIFTDLAKRSNIPIQEVKMMTSILGEGEKDGTDWSEIFHLASKSQKLKDFVMRNPDIVHDAKLCLMQPRSGSVHACATIITPADKDIYHWFPVKKVLSKDGEELLVSEWEGIQLDKAGFLKEDILGIQQLDKFASCIKLIEENKGIKIDFKKIPLDDDAVYRYFGKGWNSDVFQFGTQGLKKYTKELKPDSMEELSATNALYRPGAMKSNAHNDFVMIKWGMKEPEYDYMLESVTKKTYGLYIYQEQTMRAAQVLGGFTLVEADMMRKVMLGRGKKQFRDQFYIYHDKFVLGAVANGCEASVAEKIWDKLEAFAGYGFNASHAAAYAITGYISQWFKVNHPIEFWTTAFKFAKDELVADFISEIHATGAIKISPPDINESLFDMTSNFKKNTIYWALTSIKSVGGVAAEQIMKDRDENGPYFSFEEFLSRHTFKGSKVNKTHVENLIFSGAFDKVEEIEDSLKRKRLIDFYRTEKKTKIDAEKDLMTLSEKDISDDWWWDLRQKRLTGIAFFDYKTMCDKYLTDGKYLDQDEWQSESLSNIYYSIGGYIVEVIERTSKKSGKYCSIRIESNYTFIWVSIFPCQYQQLTKSGIELIGQEGNILLLTGMIKLDTYKKENACKFWDNSELVILK